MKKPNCQQCTLEMYQANRDWCDKNCDFEKSEEKYAEKLILFEAIDEYCATLSITNNSPNIEDIKGWFEKYDEINN